MDTTKLKANGVTAADIASSLIYHQEFMWSVLGRRKTYEYYYKQVMTETAGGDGPGSEPTMDTGSDGETQVSDYFPHS